MRKRLRVAALVTPNNDDVDVQAALRWQRMSTAERRWRAQGAANARDADALCALMLAYLMVRRRPRTNMRRNYCGAVRRLVAAWRIEGTHLPRPGRDSGEAYVRRMEQEFAVATVRLHVTACRALYRALRWADATEARPFSDVEVVGAAGCVSGRLWTAEHLSTMVKIAEPVDRVLLLLGSEARLRVSEMLDLRWRDVHLDPAEPCLVVSTESLRHPRQVALAPAVVAALWALGRLEPSEFVLPFRSSTRARQRLRRLQVRAGVPIEAGRSLDRLRSVSGVDA